MAASNSFTPLLQDKALVSDVLLGCWCPTMDLLALFTDDGQLAIHRLEWQKLWVARPDSAVTALCWRPDGKVLAAGHENGGITLYDVEKCEEVAVRRGVMGGASSAAGGAGAAVGVGQGHSAPVAHLSWVEAAADGSSKGSSNQSHHLYRHMRLFSRPPFDGHEGPGGGGGKTAGAPGASGAGGRRPDQGGGAGSHIGEVSGKNEWPQPPQALSVLVSTDVRGAVQLCAFGEVPLAVISLVTATATLAGTAGRGGPLQLAQAYMSRDLAHLITATAPPPSPPAPAPAPGEEDGDEYGCTAEGDAGASASSPSTAPAPAHVTATLFRCPKLSRHRQRLTQCAVLCAQLHEMIELSQSAVAGAAREWGTGQSELSKRMTSMSSTLEDHDPNGGSAEEQLVCMLAAGCVSPGMSSFLCGTLTEHGLRRLAAVVDGAVGAVQRALLDKVLPAIEVVVFLLGELRGLATQRSGAELGLQESACGVAEVEGCKLLLCCEALRLRLTRVGAQYRTFFAWLLKTVMRLEESSGGAQAAADGAAGGDASGDAAASLSATPISTEVLLDFLSGQLKRDAIGPDLQETCFYYPEDGDPPPASLDFDSLLAKSDLVDLVALAYGGKRASAAGAEDEEDPVHAASRLPEKPMRQQLKRVAELCRGLFRQLQAALSPDITPVAQVPLLPLADPRASLPLPVVEPPWLCMSLPQLPSEAPDAPLLLAVHVPGGVLLQYQQARDARHVTAAGSGSGSGSGSGLMVIRISAGQLQDADADAGQPAAAATGSGSELGASQHHQPQLHLHATVLQLPTGCWAVHDAAFYKPPRLALVASQQLATTSPNQAQFASSSSSDDATDDCDMDVATPARTDVGGGHVAATHASAPGSSSSSGWGDSRLLLLDTADLELQPLQVPLHQAEQAASSRSPPAGSTLLHACLAAGAVAAPPGTARWRSSKARQQQSSDEEQTAGDGAVALQGSVTGGVSPLFTSPLLVSGPRGVAAVFTTSQRAMVLDLEEDEEQEEGEEGEAEDDEGREGGGPDGGDEEEGGSCGQDATGSGDGGEGAAVGEAAGGDGETDGGSAGGAQQVEDDSGSDMEEESD